MTDSDVNISATKAKNAFDYLLSSKTLPSAVDIYHASNLLYDLNHANISEPVNRIQMISESFYSILSSLDESYLASVVLKDIQLAFRKLVHEASVEPIHSSIGKCMEGLKAFWVFYANAAIVNFSRHLCALGFNSDICFLLRRFYDLCTSSSKDSTGVSSKETVLSTLSSLLLYGLIDPVSTRVESEDECIRHVIKTIEMLSSENSYCLGDLINWQNENPTVTTLEQAINFRFSKEVQMQKDYIKSILNNSKDSYTSLADEQLQLQLTSRVNATSILPVKVAKISGLQRLVSQLKQLFPQYGDGYLETALVCYNHDVDRATSVLLEAESDPSFLHPRLQVLDKKLPARQRDGKDDYRSLIESSHPDDIEAMENQKARMKKLEQDQENEAYLLSVAMNEYNDEYDDQYDGIGDDSGATGAIGAADAGLYDMDYTAIKAYNRVVKDLEAERAFWDESRNLNQRKSKSEYGTKAVDQLEGGSSDDESEGIYSDKQRSKNTFGPDKGKGGRLIGSDGKYLPNLKKKQIIQNQQVDSSNSQAKITADMTKTQRLRKNSNKARIGNHNRKDRAMKKNVV